MNKISKEVIEKQGWVFQYKGNWSDIYKKEIGSKKLELWYDESGETDMEVFHFDRSLTSEDRYYHPTSYCIFKGSCKSIKDFNHIHRLLNINSI